MKRQGYILIFFVILLAFVSFVAMYSMERLRLAMLIEENRTNTIRVQAAVDSTLAYLEREGNIETALHLLRDFIDKGIITDTKEYDTSLFVPDGTVRPAKAKIFMNDQQIQWRFTIGEGERPYTATQTFFTPFDRSAREGGVSLLDKMQILEDMIRESGLPYLETDGDLLIRLSDNRRNWEVYELPEVEDPVTEAPDTEDTEPPEEVSETEPVDPDTEPVVTEPPQATEPPVTEPPVTESAAEPVLITTFPVKEKIYLIANGDVRIATKEQIANHIYGLMVLRGDLSLKQASFQGVVLQEGRATGNSNAQITGFYESNYASNVQQIRYYPGIRAILNAGIDLPGFVTIRTRTLQSPPPEEFDGHTASVL